MVVLVKLVDCPSVPATVEVTVVTLVEETMESLGRQEENGNAVDRDCKTEAASKLESAE